LTVRKAREGFLLYSEQIPYSSLARFTSGHYDQLTLFYRKEIMRFTLQKDGLNQYWIQDNFDNLVGGPFDNVEAANLEIESLTQTYKVRYACAWNGHDLDDLAVAKVAKGYGSDTVCHDHHGVYNKSLKGS
jgi:hypothetical protein